MRSLVVSLFACFFAAAAAEGEEDVDRPFPIEADPVVQKQIESALRPLEQLTNDDFARNLAQVLADSNKDPIRFIDQVMYFTCHVEPVLATGPYRLLLWAEVSQHDCARALGKHLYSHDARLRNEVRELFPFANFAGRRRDCLPDYSGFGSLIREGRGTAEVTEPLTRMMFEVSPSAAFLFFHTEAKREIVSYRRLERIVSNALYEKQYLGGIAGGKCDGVTADALRQLAVSKHWWSRLFVSETMVQNKELRDSEVLGRLAKDDHKLISQSARSVAEPGDLRASKVER